MKKKRKEVQKGINDKDYGFIYSNFLSAVDYLKEIKNYIWLGLVLFFLTGIFGYFFPLFFEEQVLNLVKELIKETEGLGALDLVRFIFINNLQSSFLTALFGIFFGVVPLITILFNGYVLGFVANKTVALEGIGVLWRLVPHGIFEIPAVLISIAMGLKLGFFWVKSKEKTRSLAALITSGLFFIFSFFVLIIIIFFIFLIMNPGALPGENSTAGLEVFLTGLLGGKLMLVILLALAIGSLFIGKLILSKEDKKEFLRCLLNSLRVFAFIVIPLLMLAAIIEGLLIVLLE